MGQNSLPVIEKTSITEVDGVANRPVYMLKLNGGQQFTLVIKGELGTEAHKESVRWAGRIMKQTTGRLVKYKALTRQEQGFFIKAAMAAYPKGTPQNEPLKQPLNWFKMPYVAGLEDSEWRDYANMGPKITAIVRRLTDTVAWKDLGKIVAADIFSGNGDRFDISEKALGGAPNPNWGKPTNPGNILFDGAGDLIGLDAWDSTAKDQLSNLSDRAVFERLAPDSGLKVLTDDAKRQAFAANCVAKTGEEISKWMVKSGVPSITVPIDHDDMQTLTVEQMKTWFNDLKDEFQAGLVEGAIALRNYLQGIERIPAKAAKTPEGVRARMNFLGWTEMTPAAAALARVRAALHRH